MSLEGYIGDLQAGVKAVTATGQALQDTAGVARSTYDKVNDAARGVQVTPAGGTAATPGATPTAGQAAAQATTDKITGSDPWYKRPAVLWSIAGGLVVVLVLKVFFRRRG